jgi:hypothetical protein
LGTLCSRWTCLGIPLRWCRIGHWEDDSRQGLAGTLTCNMMGNGRIQTLTLWVNFGGLGIVEELAIVGNVFDTCGRMTCWELE